MEKNIKKGQMGSSRSDYRTETDLMENEILSSLHQQQMQHENCDNCPGQQWYLHMQFAQGIAQLNTIFEVLRSETVNNRGVCSTLAHDVETQLAKCISQCLADSPEQKRDISQILAFLKSYKVVQSLPKRKPSVSLHKVHLILQDNYPDSYLCGLMNILLAGFMNVQTKVITF
ncbi:MAG TPA: hypothetical protein PLZ52_12195 [Bacteroidales bacterium]|nr:hypothetical protein [Bacteroidales bacterium]